MDTKMDEERNLSVLYSTLMDHLKDMDQNDPHFSDTLDKLYNSLYDDVDGNHSIDGDVWNEDFIIGEEVSLDSMKYMKMRPYIYGTILVVVTILGICCNIAVGCLIMKRNYTCPTAMRVLVLNLILACLVFLIGGIPLLLVENVFGEGWILGHTACQIHRYVIYVSFYTISYSLVLLLFYMFLSMWIPHLVTKYIGAKIAAIVCFSLWILILMTNIPNYLGHGITEELAGVSYCYHKDIQEDQAKVRAWTILQFIFTFAIPLVLMISLVVAILSQMCKAPPGDYSQLLDESHSSRQVVTLAICMTLVFAICWTPDKIFSLMLVLQPRRMGISLLIASDIMMCLAYINPALNPIVVLLTSPHIARGSRLRPIRNGGVPGPEGEGEQTVGAAEPMMHISSV